MTPIVRLDNGELSIGAIAFGASLVEVGVADREGAVANVVLGLDSPERYLERAANPHLGAIAGRFANRLGGARFVLGGRVVSLTANEGRNCLHGGDPGFSRRPWAIVDHGPSSVTFELTSEDGDQGFPGTCVARCCYRIDGPSLHIELTATTDAPTVVNLTNHAYWNLSGVPRSTVADHLLEVSADRYVPVDDDLIPTGTLAPVEGTPFDLRSAAELGERRLDHCLVFGERRSARLVHPASGRCLSLDTTEPGVQVYTGSKLRPPHVASGGVCLEAQRLPDAPNQPAFERPPLPSSVLRPGETYCHRTSIRFSSLR